MQEQRALSPYEEIATSAAAIVIVPVSSQHAGLPPEYYANLARVAQREEVDIEPTQPILATVGYSAMDIVEMPGQFTRRGEHP